MKGHEADANSPGQARSEIMIVVADPDLHAYVKDCLSHVTEVRIIESLTDRDPDLVVTDALVARCGDPSSAAPRLYVLNEAHAVGAASDPVDFILAPFDAHTLAHAVRRALRRPRGGRQKLTS